MPPKKVTEDKTFGLKNKNKSKKVQKHIQQLQSSSNIKKPVKVNKELPELGLYEPVKIIQKFPVGIDPKTIFCINFRNKCCNMGLKCKFSHILNQPVIEKEVEKAPVYETTSEIIQGETDIICKYFLDAVEKKEYGWFWECPTIKEGLKCIYRHVLPVGYELKTGKKEKVEVKSIEELIESKRLLLKSTTLVTAESFKEWKQKRVSEREKLLSEQDKQRMDNIKKKVWSGMSGREMFQFNKEMQVDVEDELVMEYQELKV